MLYAVFDNIHAFANPI